MFLQAWLVQYQQSINNVVIYEVNYGNSTYGNVNFFNQCRLNLVPQRIASSNDYKIFVAVSIYMVAK